MIVLSNRRSQTVVLQRKRVLEDVAVILHIIPSSLVDRTGRLVQVGYRFDASVSRGTYSSSFDRGAVHVSVFEY
jgi:hypothetical protein